MIPLLQAYDDKGQPIPHEVMARHMAQSPRFKAWQARMHHLQAMQRQIAAQPVRHGKHFKVKGRIDLGIMQHWRARFADQKEADGSAVDPWAHDEFWRDMQRDNPELRPNIQKPGNRVGYGDGASLVVANKYTKLSEVAKG
jgi:hypothetical protein